MAATKTIHGGRCYVYVDGDGAQPEAIAIFENVSVSVDYGVQVPFVIGKHSGGEVVLTHLNPVSISLSGPRLFGVGPYSASGGMTILNDMVTNQRELTIRVVDRQNAGGLSVITVSQVKIHRHNFNVSARDLSRLSLEGTGLTFSDESGAQADPAGDVTYGATT